MTRFLKMLFMVGMILGLIGCRGSSAGGRTNVSGQVTMNGKPLANAEVQLFKSEGGAIFDMRQPTRTDGNGNYRINLLMPGVYRLEITRAGEGVAIPGAEASMGRLQFTIPQTQADQSLTQNFAIGNFQSSPAPAPPSGNNSPAKGSQVSYKVQGTTSPIQQSAQIQEALGKMPAIEPGSIQVFQDEVRFRLKPGYNLLGLVEVLQKLGYRVTSTSTAPLP